jgi:O-antigen/teichoic acid export membrane protein
MTPVENGVSLRRLGRDTAVYLSGTILARVVSFVMLPVYTRILTPTDYGLLQILDLVVEITSILVSAGATAGTLRFYFKATTEEARKTVMATAFATQVSLNGMGTVLLLLVSPIVWKQVLDGEGSLLMVQIAAINFTLGPITSIPILLFQARQQSVRYVMSTVGKLVLQLSGNIVFVVVLRWGPLGVLVSTLLSHLVTGLLLTVVLFRYTGFRFSWKVFRDLRRFGLPLQFGIAGLFLLMFADRFVLQHLEGLAAVGIYGLANQFGFLLSSVFAPFVQAWYPQALMLTETPRAERDARYNRAVLYGTLLLVTAAVGIAVFIRPALTILVGAEFRGAAALVPILLLANLLHNWNSPAGIGIHVTEKTRYSAYGVWSSVIVVFVLYAVLIPPLGAMGAAVTAVVGAGVRLGVNLYWSQRLWPVGWRWGTFLSLAVYGVGAGGAAQLLPGGFWTQVGGGVGLVGVYAALVWTTVLTPEERAALSTVLRSPADLRRLLEG